MSWSDQRNFHLKLVESTSLCLGSKEALGLKVVRFCDMRMEFSFREFKVLIDIK